MHVALARKYRPKAFADLVGQEHVARALRGAIAQGRVAHGYLFSGPRGVGKTTAARILAMALNCDTRHDPSTPRSSDPSLAGEPCGRCASCQRIWSGGASLDVVEIDAASNRGVDDARELRERAMYAASQEGRHKIYIVDEAHMLTREAWNTLLKVLEEPPPGVVFVFATTEPGKITNSAAPVMSRLQRFDFRRVGQGAIAERVSGVAGAERLDVAPDAVELISRVADGGMRDALSVLDQVTAFGGGAITAGRVREVLGLVDDEVYAELLAIVVERRPADVFPLVARLADAGVDLVAFADGAGDLWRAALAASLGARPDGVSAALAERVQAAVQDLVPGDLIRILRSLEESEEAIRRGGNARLVLETLLARWALMDRTVLISELLGERGGERGEARAVEVRGEAGEGERSVRVVRDVVVRPAPSHASTPSPLSSVPLTAPPSPLLPLSLDAVQRAWPAIADALRADRKMIAAEALARSEVAAVQGSAIVLKPAEGDQMAAEGLGRYRAVIDAAASRVLGTAVQVGAVGDHVATPESSVVTPSPVPRPPSPQRVTVSGARAERTKALRGKDPALDSAMDALDLELLE